MALWSEREQRLVLARDRVGIKPLYYSQAGQNLLFGSELKAILGHPDASRNLDLDALQDYLSLNYVPGENTLVEGIQKLRPGHLLESRRGKVWIRPYWQIQFAPDPHPAGLEDANPNSTRCCGNPCATHADCGRSAGRMGQRRPGFIGRIALCRGGIFHAAQDIFYCV